MAKKHAKTKDKAEARVQKGNARAARVRWKNVAR